MIKGSDGAMYVKNVLEEQFPTSPHLYTKGEHNIGDGDILIDAGVCEGNFALKYVDVCSKIYLFEPEARWLEPLYYTFIDYADKVALIPKFVSDTSRGNYTTIDNVVPNKLNENVFLKMDIEGAEISALRGGKNFLSKNKVKASVCSYHNPDDLWKIRSVFKSHGYETWTSDGWMILLWEERVWETSDFRKGVVHAKNY